MTRKQAVLQAIEQLDKDEENSSIVEKLKEILEELPLSVWTQKSIIDTVETYAIELGNMLPLATDLTSKNGLPSSTVIFNKFVITSMDIFLKEYFPMFNKQCKKHSPYNDKEKEYFVNTFIENYIRIKNKFSLKYIGSKTYDKYKEKNTPHTATIIKNCNCKSYEDLLILCGFQKPKKEIKTTTSISYNDSDDQITELKSLLSGMDKM